MTNEKLVELANKIADVLIARNIEADSINCMDDVWDILGWHDLKRKARTL